MYSLVDTIIMCNVSVCLYKTEPAYGNLIVWNISGWQNPVFLSLKAATFAPKEILLLYIIIHELA